MSKHGHIYFVTDGEAIKIGFATKLKRRMSDLEISNPMPLFLLGSIPGTDAEERVIHGRFRHLCIKGEWFWAKKEILDFMAEFQARNEWIEGDSMKEYENRFPLPPRRNGRGYHENDND